jgi:predicted enzyme related to lactoylglutathione lyase
MAIKQIGLSWIGVKDTNKSKDFFVNTLGLNIFEEQAEFGWLELQAADKNQILGIGRADQNSCMPAGVNAVVTFVTDNYDQTKQELTKKGVTFFGEVANVPGVPRMVSFKDPDGNTFQLVEETPGHTDNIK